MGDMADYYLEQALMFDEFDPDYDTELEGIPGRNRLPKICARCGISGLHWEHHPEGWRLHHANGARHWCKPADFLKHNKIKNYLFHPNTTVPYLRWAQRLKFYKVL